MLSSTAATIRSTFAFSISCCASNFPNTRSSVSVAAASRAAAAIICCTISSFIPSSLVCFVNLFVWGRVPSPVQAERNSAAAHISQELPRLPQLDPRREVRRFVPTQHRRSRKSHPVQHPHAGLDVFHQRIRDLVRHSKPCAGGTHILARASQSRRPRPTNLRHDLRKILRIQESTDF